MLISTEVEVVWSKWKKEYYILRGYCFTKIGDIFIVKIEDVDPNSSTTIEYKCDYCKTPQKIYIRDYNKQKRDVINKDCCGKCAHLKNIAIKEEKSELGLLNKSDYGYWKFYSSRLKELSIFLKENKVEDLHNDKYSPLTESIYRNKDNIIDMILELKLNVYDVCDDLHNLYFHINKNNIENIIAIFIDKNKYFPSLLEMSNILQLSYRILVKCGGYYCIKNNMGFNSDISNTKLINIKSNMETLEKYKGISGVYKITNIINGKVYIGQAMDLWNRINSGYIYSLPKGSCHNIHLQRAWDKDGGENFYIDIIETCDIKILTEREQFWINQTQCFNNKFGYNILEFADSNRGAKISEETRKKISDASKLRFGWHHTQDVKDHLSDIRSKSIIQLDLDGNYIKEWRNSNDASIALTGKNTNATNIRECANGRGASSCGFLWINKDEYNKETFNKMDYENRDKTKRRVVQLSLDCEYLKTFRTMTEAKNETKASNISACLCGLQHKSGGFKWMYEEDYLK